MRTLQDEIEILDLCKPIRDHQGGIWMGRNEQFADATFVDYGACRAFARAARVLPHLVEALEECLEYFEERYDVVDGAEGEQRPNTEMKLGEMIKEAMGK